MGLGRTGLLALALLWPGAPAVADELRYVVLLDGHRVGHQRLWDGDAGAFHADMAYATRDGAVTLRETHVLAPDGTQLRYEATGQARDGSPVSDRFARDGQVALYVPGHGLPALLSIALRASAADADGAVPLAGGGELRLRRLGGVDLIQAGRRRSVDLVAFAGLAPRPVVAWVTTDATPRVFAILDSAVLDSALLDSAPVDVVERGWEGVHDTLLDRQARMIADDEARLLDDLAHPLGGRVLVRNVRAWDAAAGAPGALADVVVEAGQVLEAAAPGLRLRGRKDIAWELDADGGVLRPPGAGVSHAGPWGRLLDLAGGAGADLVVVPLAGAPPTLVLRGDQAYYPAEIHRALDLAPRARETILVRADTRERPRSRLESDAQPLIWQ